jgi:uncharacterized membrane protein HdeD (DUF308 family)
MLGSPPSPWSVVMTTTTDPRGVHDLPTWVRRSWLVPLTLGILLAIVGVILLVNVNAGISTLRWLVVIELVLAAVQAFATASLRHRPWVGWVAGILYLIGAIVGLVWPDVTLLALVLTVGVSLLVAGAVEAVQAWQLRGSAHGWGWSFAIGLLSVVAGLVFLFGNPAISLVALAIVLAIYTIMAGITLIMMAFAVRRLTEGTVESLRRPAMPD